MFFYLPDWRMSHPYDETATDVPVRDSTLTLSRPAASPHAGHFLLLTDCCSAESTLHRLSVCPRPFFMFISLMGLSSTESSPSVSLLLLLFQHVKNLLAANFYTLCLCVCTRWQMRHCPPTMPAHGTSRPTSRGCPGRSWRTGSCVCTRRTATSSSTSTSRKTRSRSETDTHTHTLSRQPWS